MSKTAKELYGGMFTNYISPSRYERLSNNHYKTEYLPKGYKEIIKVIKECKTSKKIVGKLATAIRGYYTYVMLYKDASGYKPVPTIRLKLDPDAEGSQWIWKDYIVMNQRDKRLPKYVVLYKDERIEVTDTKRDAKMIIQAHWVRNQRLA